MVFLAATFFFILKYSYLTAAANLLVNILSSFASGEIHSFFRFFLRYENEEILEVIISQYLTADVIFSTSATNCFRSHATRF